MRKPALKPQKQAQCSLKYESVSVESLFDVLDAVAWIDLPSSKTISQFTGSDPRTVGKALKNCRTMGILEAIGTDKYTLALPYPYKGTKEQKQTVVRESLVRMPLMVHMRQFLSLGDKYEAALRKSATMIGVENYSEAALAPLLTWAKQLKVLDPDLLVEDLIEEATKIKERRHKEDDKKLVVFLSHSSHDKAFVRQLSADLTKAGVGIWLDEQRILVGDSIVEKVGQGLVESDFFIIVLSEASVESEWVKKELNRALLSEIEKRRVIVLPAKLNNCKIPDLIKDKKYANFAESYRQGFKELMAVMNSK